MAAVAELYNHHPDIEIHYDEVIVSTNTHEAGGVVTEKDMLLAERIAEIYQKLKR